MSTNDTPVGKAPASLNAAVGVPVVVTWKLNRLLSDAVKLEALVIAGAAFTWSVKLCCACVPTPLFAVIVIG